MPSPLLALAFWLVSLAGGEDSYRSAYRVFASPAGLVFLGGCSLAFFYHLFNGLRHLFWDAGWGFERPSAPRERVVRGDRRRRLDGGSLGFSVARRSLVSLRSPLGRVLGLGSAKDGTVALVGATGELGRAGSADAVVLLFAAAAALARLSTVLRAWLAVPMSGFLTRAAGRRADLSRLSRHRSVIVEDYVHDARREGLRCWCRCDFCLRAAAAARAVFAILRVAFGR